MKNYFDTLKRRLSDEGIDESLLRIQENEKYFSFRFDKKIFLRVYKDGTKIELKDYEIGGEWALLKLTSPDGWIDYSKDFLRIIRYILSLSNGDRFDCCSRFNECSLLKQCINPHPHISRNCNYKVRLKKEKGGSI